MNIDAKNKLVAIKSFARGNALPLDSSEIYDSYEEALEYANSPTAYVGQTIKVLENGKYHTYVIQPFNDGHMLEETGINFSGSYDDLTDTPSSLPSPESISINGQSYDGSEQVDIGIQGITYGGTGATTAEQARKNLGAASENSIASFLLPNTYNNENVYLVNKSSWCYESHWGIINTLYAIYIIRGLTFIDPSGNIISPNEDIYLKSDEKEVKMLTDEYHYGILYRYGNDNNSQYLYIDHTGEMMYLSPENMGKELYLALFYNNDKGWYFGLCNEKTKENATVLMHDLTGLNESKNLIDLKSVDFTGKMFEKKTVYVQETPPSSPKTHYLWIW